MHDHRSFDMRQDKPGRERRTLCINIEVHLRWPGQMQIQPAAIHVWVILYRDNIEVSGGTIDRPVWRGRWQVPAQAQWELVCDRVDPKTR